MPDRTCEYPDCSGPVTLRWARKPVCEACAGIQHGQPAESEWRPFGSQKILWEADPDEYP